MQKTTHLILCDRLTKFDRCVSAPWAFCVCVCVFLSVAWHSVLIVFKFTFSFFINLFLFFVHSFHSTFSCLWFAGSHCSTVHVLCIVIDHELYFGFIEMLISVPFRYMQITDTLCAGRGNILWNLIIFLFFWYRKWNKIKIRATHYSNFCLCRSLLHGTRYSCSVCAYFYVYQVLFYTMLVGNSCAELMDVCARLT